MTDLDDLLSISEEDQKLITLAKAARARIGALEGAAVRDTTGRSFTGATVPLTTVSLSAVDLAVASAYASGADGLEAAALISAEGAIDQKSMDVISEMGNGRVRTYVCDESGEVMAVLAGEN
ncbi:MAG: cytidine deaminase [Candidatus Nanopelagicales bacterium]